MNKPKKTKDIINEELISSKEIEKLEDPLLNTPQPFKEILKKPNIKPKEDVFYDLIAVIGGVIMSRGFRDINFFNLKSDDVNYIEVEEIGKPFEYSVPVGWKNMFNEIYSILELKAWSNSLKAEWLKNNVPRMNKDKAVEFLKLQGMNI